MIKTALFTPGPTPLPAAVAAAQAAEMVGHRGREFHEIHKEVSTALQELFGTREDVYVLTGSGTAALEAAVANVVSPGEKVIVVRAGYFGSRWAEICREYGALVRNIDVEWGRAVNPKLIAERLADGNNETRAVFTTAIETSTGVMHDIAEIGRVVADSGALLVVDAVSAIGGIEFLMDEWHVDVAVAASQKCLMTPPGLAFIALSKNAWKVCEHAKSPRYYWDLRRYRQFMEINETPFTPAVATFRALAQSLNLLREEGIHTVFGHHEKIARACRAGVKALGLRIFPLNPAPVVTVFLPPDEITADELREHIASRYGVIFAGGQGQLKGRVIRIAHMGYCGATDIIAAIGALERGLADLGYKFELGAGVAAAEEVLRED